MTIDVHHDLETQSPEQRREFQWAAVKRLVHHAFEHSGEFRERMEAAGLAPDGITTWDDWTRIPVLRKKALLERQATGPRLGGLLAVDFGRLARIYQSPGPIYDPEGRGPDYWGWTEGFYAAGFRKGDLVQMTFSYHLTPAGLMLEEPLRNLGCCVIPAGPGNTDKQIELLTQLPVTGFVGMASYLRIIADKAVKAGFNLSRDFKLRTAFVAAERLPQSLRASLEADLGMAVRQGYGTADLGCIAYECPALGGMHLSTRCLVEICDPVTHEPLPEGATGEVVVTPFNDAYPLLRFATGDLSYLVTGACACGRTSPKLGGIVGRVDDTAKVKGQFVYPSQVAEAVAGFPGIQGWQVVVENPGGRDALYLDVVAPGSLDEAALVAACQAVIKLRPAIRRVESLPGDAPPLVDRRVFDD